MNITIRPVKQEDAAALHTIRTLPGVRENVYGIPSQKLADSEAFISSLSANDHLMVAEVDGVVVGCAGLHVSNNPRTRHTAQLGIMVHTDYQGKGIGRELMESLIDIADNYLKMVRIELGVMADNEHAVHLYKSCGFVVEGTKKYAAIRDGQYHDMLLMARYSLI